MLARDASNFGTRCRMAKYLFSVKQHGSLHGGSEVELPDLEAVKEMATQFAGDLIKERNGSIFDRDLVLEVSDSDGLMLLRIVAMGTLSAAAGQVGQAPS